MAPMDTPQGGSSPNGMSSGPPSGGSAPNGISSGTPGPRSSPNGMSSPGGGTTNSNAVSDPPPTNGTNNSPNGSSTVGQPVFDPELEVLEWDESPFDASAAPKGRYAIETRAESTRVVTGGDAARRGEMDQLFAGWMESFVDGVSGEENTRINGTLLERTGRGSVMAANRLETTVNGRLSISAVGWEGASFSGEDGIILGGALTDTWTARGVRAFSKFIAPGQALDWRTLAKMLDMLDSAATLA